ncbi:MAG: radical SAM protein [Myxococcaceae bacterium]
MGRHQLTQAAQARLSRETGTCFKQAPLSVALCYPSPYHVAMSSLGYQQIYRQVNAHPDACAERAVLPDDLEAHRGVPLFTLETQRDVSSFELLAFSVAYELELLGLFSMLELAGLSVFREQRPATAPLVVAGGPLTFSNPDPLEPFVDVLVQGEADELIHQLLDEASAGGGKAAVLERLAKRPGFRVPGVSAESTRYFVAKASDAALPAHSVVVTPDTELSNMFLVEPERGCSRGCHYCVMRRTTNGGMRKLPYEKVLSLVPEHAPRVGLVGAAVTDHPEICELLEALVARGKQVGVSSLRADRLTARLVNALKSGGARHLTVASDGASQRLRDLVDRKHSEEQLIRAAKLASDAGLERLKVYNIVGLPTETDADIDELVRFTLELSKVIPVALGVAPFAAKRNTPMDGAPFAGIEVVEGRLERIRKGLNRRAELRPVSARWAWVEHMMAQCGPEGGLAAHDAHLKGGGFGAFKKAFKERACEPYLARRVADGRRVPVEWPVSASAVGREVAGQTSPGASRHPLPTSGRGTA